MTQPRFIHGAFAARKTVPVFTCDAPLTYEGEWVLSKTNNTLNSGSLVMIPELRSPAKIPAFNHSRHVGYVNAEVDEALANLAAYREAAQEYCNIVRRSVDMLIQEPEIELLKRLGRHLLDNLIEGKEGLMVRESGIPTVQRVFKLTKNRYGDDSTRWMMTSDERQKIGIRHFGPLHEVVGAIVDFANIAPVPDEMPPRKPVRLYQVLHALNRPTGLSLGEAA